MDDVNAATFYGRRVGDVGLHGAGATVVKAGGPPPWVPRLAGPGLPLAVAVVQAFGTWAASRDQPDSRAYDLLALALLVGTGLALAGRDRAPVGTLVVVGAGTALYYGLNYPYGPAFVALLVATMAAVRQGRQVEAWATLGGGYLVFFAVGVATGSGRLSVTVVLTHLAGLAAIAGIAAFVNIRAEHFAEVRERVAESRRRQASEERLLLARELHDALAHNVSLISVQASTALHLFDEDPERARSALAAIKAASHETLQELRATVGALRADDERVPTAPTAGLERLGELVAQSRDVGLEVRLQRVGNVRQLPTQVELAAYRIVQEALTNVRRHSGASAAEVVIDYRPDELDIRVTDFGRGSAPAGVTVEHQPGHGLRGMRERALALGGTLHASPGAAGGFVVSARLPLGVAQTPPSAAQPT